MKELPSISSFTLKPKEICPYKDTCCFNKGSERCYGTIERNNQFVCNLSKLKLMNDQKLRADLNKDNNMKNLYIVQKSSLGDKGAGRKA